MPRLPEWVWVYVLFLFFGICAWVLRRLEKGSFFPRRGYSLKNRLKWWYRQNIKRSRGYSVHLTPERKELLEKARRRGRSKGYTRYKN